VAEIRKLQRMMEAEMQELLEIIAKRNRQINKVATAILVDLWDTALDLEKVVGVESGKKRFEFGDKELRMLEGVEDEVQKDKGEDGRMEDQEDEEARVAAEMARGEGSAE
jgi:hypothetical protein